MADIQGYAYVRQTYAQTEGEGFPRVANETAGARVVPFVLDTDPYIGIVSGRFGNRSLRRSSNSSMLG
jgi:hypothetical protein